MMMTNAKETEKFVYFEDLTSISTEFSKCIKENEWRGAALQNFCWKATEMKTLICHDFRGGYLPYERFDEII